MKIDERNYLREALTYSDGVHEKAAYLGYASGILRSGKIGPAKNRLEMRDAINLLGRVNEVVIINNELMFESIIAMSGLLFGYRGTMPKEEFSAGFIDSLFKNYDNGLVEFIEDNYKIFEKAEIAGSSIKV